jgi:hypothetical protein
VILQEWLPLARGCKGANDMNHPVIDGTTRTDALILPTNAGRVAR